VTKDERAVTPSASSLSYSVETAAPQATRPGFGLLAAQVRDGTDAKPVDTEQVNGVYLLCTGTRLRVPDGAT